ncbi:hypothetical protein AAF712_011706 [Marasmius tenuissimus]|uniref:Uncharacterized protein n=1 Tax=Marasmius tenuissimus TaxID=585030 RepID=A0ABR2ZJH5_9AGAR
MPKTARVPAANGGNNARALRTQASVSIKEEDEIISLRDLEYSQRQHEEEDLASDMSKFLQEFRRMQSSTYEDKWTAYSSFTLLERQAKKSTMVNAAFENQKKALYAASRKRAQEAMINKLLESYDNPLDNLFPRRAEIFAASEQMIKENPARREKALKSFLSKAHEQLEESRKQEMAATDASCLIKHYKALLRR